MIHYQEVKLIIIAYNYYSNTHVEILRIFEVVMIKIYIVNEYNGYAICNFITLMVVNSTSSVQRRAGTYITSKFD